MGAVFLWSHSFSYITHHCKGRIAAGKVPSLVHRCEAASFRVLANQKAQSLGWYQNQASPSSSSLPSADPLLLTWSQSQRWYHLLSCRDQVSKHMKMLEMSQIQTIIPFGCNIQMWHLSWLHHENSHQYLHFRLKVRKITLTHVNLSKKKSVKLHLAFMNAVLNPQHLIKVGRVTQTWKSQYSIGRGRRISTWGIFLVSKQFEAIISYRILWGGSGGVTMYYSPHLGMTQCSLPSTDFM